MGLVTACEGGESSVGMMTAPRGWSQPCQGDDGSMELVIALWGQ